MSRSGIAQHDHDDTKTQLAIKKNSSLDTMSEVKHYYNESLHLLPISCAYR
jgi:hypothetical protein